MTDDEKIKSSQEGLTEFLKQFNNNSYTNIVLEILFEEMAKYERDNISISREKGQEGDKSNN